jgi:hypothetical protein
MRPLLVATNAMSGEKFDQLLQQIGKVKVEIAQEKVRKGQGSP